MIQLSKRLERITYFVKPYKHVIDIGTDHCLVPISLLLQNLIDNAIATDINKGPLDEAIKNVYNYNLDDKVDFRLGNGLSPITSNDNCDVIIIAGMGGKLISEILDTGRHIMHLNKRLILQANVYEESVRKWLRNNKYEITNEEIIKEDNFYYEIIVGDKSSKNVNYTDLEIKFGPILLKEKSAIFLEKWHNILLRKKEIYHKIPHNHINKKRFFDEIKEIEFVLNE